jgi:hypothetical protein
VVMGRVAVDGCPHARERRTGRSEETK